MKITALHHLLVAYMLALAFNYAATIGGKSFIAYENEAIENFQALLLFFSTLVFAVYLVRCAPPLRAIAFCGFLFFLTMLLRELDIESFKISNILIQIGSGHGRNIILLSFWLIALAYLFEHRRRNLNVLLQLFHSRSGRLTVIGVLFLLLGEILDALGHGVILYEELTEIFAYYFMLAGALLTPKTLNAIHIKTIP